MNVSRLEKHLVELIKEEQVKLGYQRESIHLYYPLTSLNHLLKTSYDVEMMQCMLQEYGKSGKSILGELCISQRSFLYFNPGRGRGVCVHPYGRTGIFKGFY